MKNILTFTLVILFLTACTNVKTAKPMLFQQYSQYKEHVTKNNINERAEEYFTSSLLGNNYLDNPEAKSQLLFKNYMSSIAKHYEKVNFKSGCLTINGFDEDKEPLIFNLKYTSVNEKWLIGDIHVVFVDDVSDFSNKAKCPQEYTN